MGTKLERVQENNSPHLSWAGLNGQEDVRGRVSLFFHTVMMMHLSAHRKHAPVSSSALMTGLPAEDGSYAHAVVYVQLECVRVCV